MEGEPSSQDLVIVAAVVFLGLVAFIAVLFLNRKTSGKAAGTPNAKIGEPGETGTVFIKEEDGRVVRRSTRQHKPVTPLVGSVVQPLLSTELVAEAAAPARPAAPFHRHHTSPITIRAELPACPGQQALC